MFHINIFATLFLSNLLLTSDHCWHHRDSSQAFLSLVWRLVVINCYYWLNAINKALGLANTDWCSSLTNSPLQVRHFLLNTGWYFSQQMSSSDEHEEESDPTPSSDINLEQDAPWKENQRQRMKDLFHVNWFLL